MADTLTLQDYKKALNVAMLYAQSTIEDVVAGASAPSERSIRLLRELTTIHGNAVKAAAAEFNTPPK